MAGGDVGGGARVPSDGEAHYGQPGGGAGGLPDEAGGGVPGAADA